MYQWEQRLFDGSTATFERLRRPDSVIVFPVTADKKVLLIEDEQPGRAPVLTAPGGEMDEGETPLEAVARELREETGYEAETYELWQAIQPSAKIDWAIYFFIAKNCRQVTEPKLDAGEKITLKPVDFDTFVELGMREDFLNREVSFKLLRAKLEPGKMDRIREMFLN